MMKNINNLLLFLFSVGTPFILCANVNFTYINNLTTAGTGFLIILIPILVALALALFLWGLVIFIKNSGDEKVHEEGRQKMMWGIVALFAIVTVWGLVALVQELTGIDGTSSGLTAPDAPTL